MEEHTDYPHMKQINVTARQSSLVNLLVMFVCALFLFPVPLCVFYVCVEVCASGSQGTERQLTRKERPALEPLHLQLITSPGAANHPPSWQTYGAVG